MPSALGTSRKDKVPGGWYEVPGGTERANPEPAIYREAARPWTFFSFNS
jgi:hypothetical protein